MMLKDTLASQCPIETLSVRASDSESAVIGTARRVLQLVCLGCLSILFLVFVITQILHLSLRTHHGLFPSRHSQILLFSS